MLGLLVVIFALLVLRGQLVALESGAAPVLAPKRSQASSRGLANTLTACIPSANG